MSPSFFLIQLTSESECTTVQLHGCKDQQEDLDGREVVVVRLSRVSLYCTHTVCLYFAALVCLEPEHQQTTFTASFPAST